MSSRIRLNENDMSFSFSRSGGPGGQNVNKVNTRVTLRFDLPGTTIFNNGEKARIAERLAGRLDKDGWLLVESDRFRSQGMNRNDVVEKLERMLQSALARKKKRIATKVPAGAHARRLDAKKRRSEVKQMRRKASDLS